MPVVAAAAAASLLSACYPNPCQYHGTCVTYSDGRFYGCICQSGYSGLYCQDAPGI